MTTPHRTLLQQALDALRQCEFTSPPAQRPIVKDAIAALREALAADHLRDVAEKVGPAAPVPALRHCACEFDGDTCVTQCKLHAAHVDAIHEWAERAKAAEGKLSAAPVPLTDTETHAELWKLAVRKGLITVRSELIDPRNHGTRVSWMQGHDKACDISNDAAAHGIAASPAAPAAPVVPLTDERITKALRRAFSLGQTYWQQADSDSYTQNAKSDETRQKFETLIVETLNGITGGSK